MRISHVVPNVSNSADGVARVVLALAKAQADIGHTVTIHALGVPKADNYLQEDRLFQVLYSDVVGMQRFGYSPNLLQQIDAAEPDIIQSHSIWSYMSYASYVTARRLNVPHVCSPHGMLEPWALNRNRLKKKVLRTTFQDRVLAKSDCLHALVPEEEEAIYLTGSKTLLQLCRTASTKY